MDIESRDYVNARQGGFQSGGEAIAGLWDTATGATTREGGFALPIVIFALVLLGIMGVASLQTSRDEFLSAVAVSHSNQAFYAAEAGLHSAVSNWDQRAVDTLMRNPGDSLVGSWTTIENRCSFQLVYRRVDGGDTNARIYSVESTGQSPGMNGGRRRVGIIIGRVVGIDAAVAFNNDLSVSGSPTILGECGGLHTNGDLTLSGTPTVAGEVTSSGTVTGTALDTLGNPVTSLTNVPPVPIPELKAADYCADADYILTDGGVGIRISPPLIVSFAMGAEHWGWRFQPGPNTYVSTGSTVSDGTYCVDANVSVPVALGSDGSPQALSILSTKSVSIAGQPFLTSTHPDDILILAEGDLRIGGLAGSDDNYEGLMYGGAQCAVSGTPVLHGQFVCRDGPQPAGSANYVNANSITGDMTITYTCGGIWDSVPAAPISGRKWSHVW